MPVRLTALGYYYSHGSAKDISKIARYLKDSKKLPECHEDAKDCEWKCAGEEVETVGEYVRYCVKPALEARKPAAPPAKPATTAKASQDTEKKK